MSGPTPHLSSTRSKSTVIIPRSPFSAEKHSLALSMIPWAVTDGTPKKALAVSAAFSMSPQQRIVALAGDEKFDCLCRLDVWFSPVIIRGGCNHVAAEQRQQGYCGVKSS